MPNKLEVGNLCSVLNQPPHVLSIGFVDVVVDCFQVQAVHLEGRGCPVTRKLTVQLGERRQTAGPHCWVGGGQWIPNVSARLNLVCLAKEWGKKNKTTALLPISHTTSCNLRWSPQTRAKSEGNRQNDLSERGQQKVAAALFLQPKFARNLKHFNHKQNKHTHTSIGRNQIVLSVPSHQPSSPKQLHQWKKKEKQRSKTTGGWEPDVSTPVVPQCCDLLGSDCADHHCHLLRDATCSWHLYIPPAPRHLPVRSTRGAKIAAEEPFVCGSSQKETKVGAVSEEETRVS